MPTKSRTSTIYNSKTKRYFKAKKKRMNDINLIANTLHI